MLHDILDDDYLQWHPLLIRHYTNFWPYYWSWPYNRIWLFTLLREVSIEHLQRVRHANRGRLLPRTPGPVPYRICKCSFVETTDTQSYITPVYDTFAWLDFLQTLTQLLNTGFHRASATGVASRQGTLTPPDTWSCPTLGLASVLMLRPISPELVLFLDFWVSNIPRKFEVCPSRNDRVLNRQSKL